MLWLREISPLHYYTTLPERLKSSQTTDPSFQYRNKNSCWGTATSTNTSSQGPKTAFTMTYKPWNEITTGHSFLNSDIRVSIKSSNKQHNAASHKRQLSVTIKLAISVDDALNEVMKITAERWPEHVSCSYQPNLFTYAVFSLARRLGAESVAYSSVSASHLDQISIIFLLIRHLVPHFLHPPTLALEPLIYNPPLWELSSWSMQGEILVHDQSPFWKPAYYEHDCDKPESSHFGLGCPNEKMWTLVLVQHILTSKEKKPKLLKSQEDLYRSNDVICRALVTMTTW